jgi:hypothetical protein
VRSSWLNDEWEKRSAQSRLIDSLSVAMLRISLCFSFIFVLVPGGTVSDSILVFDSNHVAFNRNCALILPVASLEQGIVSPFQRDPILVRVTLTPIPATATTQESNTVLINQPPSLG